MSKIDLEIEKARQLLTAFEVFTGKNILKETFEIAVKITTDMTVGQEVSDLKFPVVSFCENGSVDIFWKEKKFELLLNVCDGGEIEFFGEIFGGYTVRGRFRGEIPAGLKVFIREASAIS